MTAYSRGLSKGYYNWTHGVGTAATDYLKAYSTWAYTKQAMDHWAQFIRQRMDAAQSGSALRAFRRLAARNPPRPF